MSFRSDAKDVSMFSVLMVLCVVIVVGGVTAFTVFGERIVNPFREETRYQTQQNSQAYRDGIRLQIDQMEFQYNLTSDVSARNRILSVARRQFGSLDAGTLSDLQQGQKDFLRQAGVNVN